MTRPLTSRQTALHTGRHVALTPMTGTALLTLSLVIFYGVPGAASAASGEPASAEGQLEVTAHSPWLPWLGCWHLVEETVARAEQPRDTNGFRDRVVVCLTPSTAPPGGVEVTTLANGEPVLATTLLADGAQHPVEETACTGWRQNTWSSDAARLFARVELTCDGEETRRVSGVGLMTSSTTWLDIQLVTSRGRGEVTVRRYRRATESTTVDAGATPLPADMLDRARAAARLASTRELSINDVIEAYVAVDPTVVEALLIETRASFVLDRRALIQLDDSGVRGRVIDLMVALSFPDEFVVDRQVDRTAASYGGGGGFADSFSPFGYGYNQWYPYWASPFGYYYGWSPYSSLYYHGPAASYAIVPGAADERSAGRAYQGRGYSQIGRAPTPRRAQRRGGSRTGSTSTAAARGSGGGSNSGASGGGGGQASPSGYSRGGSTGRTATPRER